MPTGLREVVSRWIADGRVSDRQGISGELNALFIYGGPAGCCYLDATGEVWSWNAWDDVVIRLEDGPDKVGIIAIVAEWRPELAEWLPRRPSDASDCQQCAGRGWLLPPWPRIQCPECVGLGWVVP